jgi:hypothetical protein
MYSATFRLITSYLSLCADVYASKFGKVPTGLQWSTGQTLPPFTQLIFILSCVTRLTWREFSGWANHKEFVVHAHDAGGVADARMPPPWKRDVYMVNSEDVVTEINAPPSTKYIFSESGERIIPKSAPAPTMASLSSLLERLRSRKSILLHYPRHPC